ncbi:MAG: PAS domain S-box protein [Elusimicrobiales bacterium]
MSISRKITLLFVSLLAALSAVFAVYTVRCEKAALRHEFDNQAGLLLNWLAMGSEYPVLAGNTEMLRHAGREMLRRENVVYCEVADKSGRILYSGGRRGGADENEYSAPVKIEKAGKDSGGGTASGGNGESGVIGRATLVLSHRDVSERGARFARTVWLLAAGGCLAAFALVSLLMSILLGKPVQMLLRGIAGIADGNAGSRGAARSPDELGRLAAAFNAMSRELKSVTVSREELAAEISGRRQAQDALSEERKRLEVTLRSIGDAVIATDRVGKIQLMNKVAEELTGWSEAQALGRPLPEVFSIVSEKTGMICESPVDKVLRNGKVSEPANHTALIRRDGTRCSIADSGAPIKDEAGEISGVILVFRDVSWEHRTAERLLALENAMQSSRTGVILTDTETKIVYLNPAFLMMWGYENHADELLGRKVLDAFKNKPVMAEIAASRTDIGKWEGETIANRRDGSRFDVFLSTSSVYDAEHNLLGIIGTAMDITERKRKDNLLRVFTENLMYLNKASNSIVRIKGRRKLFEELCEKALSLSAGSSGSDDFLAQDAEAPGTCWLAQRDENGGLSVVAAAGAPAACLEMLNREIPGLGGDSLLSRAVKEKIPHFLNRIDSAAGRDALVRCAASSGYKSCAYFPILCRNEVAAVLSLCSRNADYFSSERMEIFQIFVNQASVAYENAMLLDSLEQTVARRTAELNDQKQVAEHARALAENANAAKSAFLANMSHELRTPLNVIIVSGTMMESEMLGALNEKQHEYAGYVIKSGKHLLNLINDILDLSKVEAGRMELSPSVFAPKEILDTTLGMVGEQSVQAQVSLTGEAAFPADMKIVADERKFKQIIFNLLSNAVKFTPAGGAVTLKARRVTVAELRAAAPVPARELEAVNGGAEYILVSVADTGIGISQEDRGKLFKPFSQADSSHSRSYEGTGLGLVLVKRFVEMHNGGIWMESEAGKGSIFSFALPIREKI